MRLYYNRNSPSSTTIVLFLPKVSLQLQLSHLRAHERFYLKQYNTGNSQSQVSIHYFSKIMFLLNISI